MKLYQVFDRDTKNLLMVAPMSSISQAFRLHRDGVDRVLRELKEENAVSEVCFNNHPTPVSTSGNVLIGNFDFLIGEDPTFEDLGKMEGMTRD